MVAILGPSGSGKTSLLDILADRASIKSRDAISEGQVKSNGDLLEMGEYSKLGAYV